MINPLHRLLITMCCVSTFTAFSQSCNPDSLLILPVRASDTDANIPWELYRHYTFLNPDCTPKNTLLVHLVGTLGNPVNTQLFPSLAANNGFHVVSLKYHNDTSAQTACNNSSDFDCHWSFRREIIEGFDYSQEITVDSVNSIYNRLFRLVQYMDITYPSQNWGQFYSGDTMNWNKIIISGHSQGGGHAAVIGMFKVLKRVLMFASPNDYSSYFNDVAPWTGVPHATPDSVYYSFLNINDQVAPFNWQYISAINLGLSYYGDTVNVDQVPCPYNYSHILHTAIDSSGFTTNHGMVVNDANVPLDSNGVSIFEGVWRYMLGLDCQNLSLTETGSDDLLVYPNPAQDVLYIQAGSLSGTPIIVRILDTKGSIRHNSVAAYASSLSIDISELPPGVYVVELESSGRIVRKRLIAVNAH